MLMWHWHHSQTGAMLTITARGMTIATELHSSFFGGVLALPQLSCSYPLSY
jgi:hypothetical protein